MLFDSPAAPACYTPITAVETSGVGGGRTGGGEGRGGGRL